MKEIENNSKEFKSSLMNKALSYLSKFSTTESKLRSNLNSYSEKFFSEIRKEEVIYLHDNDNTRSSSKTTFS